MDDFSLRSRASGSSPFPPLSLTNQEMFTIHKAAQHERTKGLLAGNDNLEWFGRLVVRSSLYDREVFEQVASVVNFNAVEEEYSENDFLAGPEAALDGLIFSAMIDFRAHYVQGNPYPRTASMWIQALSHHLNDKFKRNPDWPREFFSEAIKAIAFGKFGPPKTGELDILSDGLVDYVYGVRYLKVTNRMAHASPHAQRKEVEAIGSTIRVPGEVVDFKTASDLFVDYLHSQTQTHAFRTGVRGFDRAYAEKAEPGEGWLGFGLPGSGKTILACQIAGFSAAFGRNVLMVSTEVDPSVCMLRACASEQGLSYNALKAIRGTKSFGATDQGEQVRQWAEGVGSKIMVVPYRATSGEDFGVHMQRILDRYDRRFGKAPDMVLFDWIGKAADRSFNDSWDKREHYSSIANYMAQLAKDLNIVTWTLAQADKKIKNKTTIGMDDTQDCKNLCDPMSGVLALTALMEPAEEADEVQNVYRSRQYWVIPKGREAEASKIPVVRRFEMQRFADLH